MLRFNAARQRARASGGECSSTRGRFEPASTRAGFAADEGAQRVQRAPLRAAVEVAAEYADAKRELLKARREDEKRCTWRSSWPLAQLEGSAAARDAAADEAGPPPPGSAPRSARRGRDRRGERVGHALRRGLARSGDARRSG